MNCELLTIGSINLCNWVVVIVFVFIVIKIFDAIPVDIQTNKKKKIEDMQKNSQRLKELNEKSLRLQQINHEGKVHKQQTKMKKEQATEKEMALVQSLLKKQMQNNLN